MPIMLHSVTSDLGAHCLLRQICHILRINDVDIFPMLASFFLLQSDQSAHICLISNFKTGPAEPGYTLPLQTV